MERNFIESLEKSKKEEDEDESLEKRKEEEEDEDDDIELSLQCGSSKRTKYSSSSSPSPSSSLEISLGNLSINSTTLSFSPSSSLSPPLSEQICTQQLLPPPEQPKRRRGRPEKPRTKTIPPPLSSSPSLPPPPPEQMRISPPPPPPEQPVRPRRQREILNNRTIAPPYPWATDRPAVVHKLSYLLSNQITTIPNMVRCKKCETEYEETLNLSEKFEQVWDFIVRNKDNMYERAPSMWESPKLLTCKFCSRDDAAKPIIPEDKDKINWLFLFLGQLLGCCTLKQLKYFCGSASIHRTGARDRVLYYAYLDICKQLHPERASCL